mgnify:CR=1 FL=1
MKLSNKAYDILKWAVCIVLPALSLCYSTIAPEFGWYSPDVVSKIVSAVEYNKRLLED